MPGHTAPKRLGFSYTYIVSAFSSAIVQSETSSALSSVNLLSSEWAKIYTGANETIESGPGGVSLAFVVLFACCAGGLGQSISSYADCLTVGVLIGQRADSFLLGGFAGVGGYVCLPFLGWMVQRTRGTAVMPISSLGLCISRSLLSCVVVGQAGNHG